jgi:hypothetical protein
MEDVNDLNHAFFDRMNAFIDAVYGQYHAKSDGDYPGTRHYSPGKSALISFRISNKIGFALSNAVVMGFPTDDRRSPDKIPIAKFSQKLKPFILIFPF